MAEICKKQLPEVFCKESVLQVFHRKIHVLESLFKKVAGLKQVFHVNFAKFLKTPILKNTCERLLLFCTILKTSLRSTHLFSMHLFSTLWKHQNLTVFWCFQGVEKGRIGNEWVNLCSDGLKTTFWKVMSINAIFL